MAELLTLTGIEKSYPRGDRRLRVLANLSLTMEEREIAAVLGSRYEGKTTLLGVAAGLVPPDAGTVRMAGRDLTAMTARQRERLSAGEVAWLGRKGAGLEYEVLDYVSMPLLGARSRTRDIARSALRVLERVGMRGVARRRWRELTNWERVLVSLARGIAGSPRLLIMDDLLDGLGPSKTQEAGELLRSLVAEIGCGVLMSVSDPEAALAADRVWSFDRAGLRLWCDQRSPLGEVIAMPRRVGAG